MSKASINTDIRDYYESLYSQKPEHNYDNCHNYTCRMRNREDGYVMAVEEFAKRLKHEILEEIYEISERQKDYEVGSDMSLTYSHMMGTLRDVHHRIIDSVAEQMKKGK